jgi:hypothetical protein
LKEYFSSIGILNCSFLEDNFKEFQSSFKCGVDLKLVQEFYQVLTKNKNISQLTSTLIKLFNHFMIYQYAFHHPSLYRFLIICFLHPQVSLSDLNAIFWSSFIQLVFFFF